ncbi:hypothetical protein [Streptomyces iakyrus]
MAYGDLKKSGMALYYTDNALVGVYHYAKEGVWPTWDLTEDRGSQKCRP